MMIYSISAIIPLFSDSDFMLISTTPKPWYCCIIIMARVTNVKAYRVSKDLAAYIIEHL